MKRACTLIAALLLAAATHAGEYLLEHPTTWKLYSRFDALASTFDSDSVLVSSLGLGAQVSDSLSIGAHGALVFGSVDTPRGFIESADAWQLGVRLDGRFHQTGPASVGAHLIVGAQSVNVQQGNVEVDDTAVMLQPGVDVSVGLWRGAEVGATIGYRWLDDLAAGGYTERDISGLCGGIFLRFLQLGD